LPIQRLLFGDAGPEATDHAVPSGLAVLRIGSIGGTLGKDIDAAIREAEMRPAFAEELFCHRSEAKT
jgi:hypothetical protein